MLSENFENALVFATRLHAKQTRKGDAGIPYISHLLGVASLVLENGGSEVEAIGALLHDAIEDQAEHYPGGGQALRDEITARFGGAVTDIVVACSDSDGIEKRDWRERKEAYVAHLAEASPAVLRVSCCDKLHNSRAILVDLRVHGDVLWERFTAGKASLWYYRALVEAFQSAGAHAALVDELDRTVTQIEELAGERQLPMENH